MPRTIRQLQCALLVALLACGGCVRSSARATHDQEVAQGRQLWEDNGCTACHGAEGHGDGPLTKAGSITPIDFRNPQAFVNGYGEDQIAGTIADGSVQGSQGMPAFTHLPEDERKLLAVFILSLGDNSNPEPAKSNGAQKPRTSEVMVTDAWANPPLVPQNNMSVYLTIENPTDAPRSVVSVSTNEAASAGLHQTQMMGKMMMMTSVASLAIPAKGSVQLKPGGYHIMCTGVKKPLKPGDEMKIALKLDNGKSIPVTVKVRAMDASSDGDGDGAGGMVMPPGQK